jgi:hemerythrin
VVNVPVLRWKILDNYQKQVKFLVRSHNSGEVFVWQESFAINVMQMDEQHKRLIQIANTIMEHLYNHAESESISKAFDALLDYTHYHFEEEERLMMLYNYPATSTHRENHDKLAKQVIEYKNKILGGDVPNRADFLDFIEHWLMRHVLDEDRKYGAFLNAKGIY